MCEHYNTLILSMVCQQRLEEQQHVALCPPPFTLKASSNRNSQWAKDCLLHHLNGVHPRENHWLQIQAQTHYPHGDSSAEISIHQVSSEVASWLWPSPTLCHSLAETLLGWLFILQCEMFYKIYCFIYIPHVILVALSKGEYSKKNIDKPED